MAGSRRRNAVEIVGVQRGACALAGLSSLLAGGVAVFESANQAGTTALIALGAAASLAALLGKIPLRLVVGGHEIDMRDEEEVKTAIDTVTGEMSSQQLQAALDALQREHAERPTTGETVSPLDLALSRVSAASEFEHLVNARLARLTESKAWGFETNARLPRASRDSQERAIELDALIRFPNSKNVAVEIKMIRNWSPAAAARLRVQVRDLLTRGAVSGVLVVVPGENIAERLNDQVAVRNKSGFIVRVVAVDAPNFHWDDVLVGMETAVSG